VVAAASSGAFNFIAPPILDTSSRRRNTSAFFKGPVELWRFLFGVRVPDTTQIRRLMAFLPPSIQRFNISTNYDSEAKCLDATPFSSPISLFVSLSLFRKGNIAWINIEQMNAERL